MRTIVTLKEGMVVYRNIPYTGCHPSYDTETREVIILDLEDGVMGVYNADKVEKVTFELNEPVEPRTAAGSLD